MEKQVTVIFLSKGMEDDVEAMRLLKEAGIPFVNCGPTSEEKTPLLYYGHWIFQGLQDVKDFVEGWKTGKLPPLDLLKSKKETDAG